MSTVTTLLCSWSARQLSTCGTTVEKHLVAGILQDAGSGFELEILVSIFSELEHSFVRREEFMENPVAASFMLCLLVTTAIVSLHYGTEVTQSLPLRK